MAKIYNEVVIDMNPESPTFEETIYEDSFEYEGDMMLMGQGWTLITDHPSHTDTEGNVWTVRANIDSRKRSKEQQIFKNGKLVQTYQAGADTRDEVNAQFKKYVESKATIGTPEQLADVQASQDYGLESLKKSDFFMPDGTTQKPLSDILLLIKQHKPMPDDYTGGQVQYDADITKKIEEMLPKLQRVSEEEKGFLEKERGFAERKAEMGKEADMYGLQEKAGAMGAQMRSSYGGGSMGMRGAIGGQAAMKKGAGLASDKYGLGMEKAAFEEEKGMYGLRQEQEKGFETDVSTWLDKFKQGGRVPNKKQTFLDVLSKIPDAGGS